LKIIIAYGSKGKFFHLKEFFDMLSKYGVQCKLVKDSDYSNGFPSKNLRHWVSGNKKFQKLIEEYKPDAIFVDRQTHFGLDAIKSKIPLFILLRGHYWSEQEFAKKTIHTGRIVRSVIWFRNKIAEQCFRDATAVLPICTYLEQVVKQHYPKQSTHVFFEGIDADRWYHVKGMDLNHPCVGLLQDANWWGKTKEMLLLSDVLESMPNVHFYWAGDGLYRERVLEKLNKYENFTWLGRLEYPNKVREFLSEVDVYALITGMDLAPLTLKEAQLMKKPVVATNVGGNSEMMIDKKSGFLIKEGSSEDLIEKLTILLNDKKKSKEMGIAGREFVKNIFSWEKITEKFLNILKEYFKDDLIFKRN